VGRTSTSHALMPQLVNFRHARVLQTLWDHLISSGLLMHFRSGHWRGSGAGVRPRAHIQNFLRIACVGKHDLGNRGYVQLRIPTRPSELSHKRLAQDLGKE
jgi:hypothetical protein